VEEFREFYMEWSLTRSGEVAAHGLILKSNDTGFFILGLMPEHGEMKKFIKRTMLGEK